MRDHAYAHVGKQMVRTKKKSRNGPKKNPHAKNRFFIIFLFCLAGLILFLYFSPAKTILKKIGLYRNVKGIEESLIIEDENIYKNSNSNFSGEKKSIKINDSEKDDYDIVEKEKVREQEYGKNDRDYLNKIIKNSN